MPSRWLTLAIITFWLGTTGWLVYKDVWLRYQPGQPPPFQIDLTAEAINKNRPSIYWHVSQNEKYVFRGETRIEHPEPDIFELKARFKQPPPPLPDEPPNGVAHLSGLKVTSMKSLYRVNTQGELLRIEGSIAGTASVLGFSIRIPFTAGFVGEVKGNEFHSRLVFGSPNPLVEAQMEKLLNKDLTFELNPVPVSSRGSVLMPFHPVNRIRGLKPGQSWRMPFMSPLESALAKTAGTGGGQVQFLDAHVLEEPRSLTWQGKDVSCLVIEYKGEEDQMNASTWVAQETGLVLRQEAQQGEQHWVMDRE
jgi:hypothetical protein